MEWQDISTAPKDGTWILLAGGEPAVWMMTTTEPPCVVGRWASILRAQGMWEYAPHGDYDDGEYLRPKMWAPLQLPQPLAPPA